MKNIFIIFFLVLTTCLQAQDSLQTNNISFDLGLGIQKASGTEFQRTYEYGLDLGLNARIGLLTNRVYIKPSFSFNTFSNTYKTSSKLTLNAYNLGIGIGYKVLQHKDLKTYIDFTYLNKKIEETIGPATNYEGESFTTFTGSENAFSTGVLFEYKSFALLLSHTWYKPTIELDKEYLDRVSITDDLYQLYTVKPATINLNTVQLTFYYSIKIK